LVAIIATDSVAGIRYKILTSTIYSARF